MSKSPDLYTVETESASETPLCQLLEELLLSAEETRAPDAAAPE